MLLPLNRRDFLRDSTATAAGLAAASTASSPATADDKPEKSGHQSPWSNVARPRLARSRVLGQPATRLARRGRPYRLRPRRA